MEEQTQTTQTEAPNEPKSKMGMYVAIMVVLLGVASFAYFQMTKSGTQQTNTETETTTETPAAMTDTENTQVTEISVEAGSFYYKPAVMKIKVGDKVKVTMTAMDMQHDFNIDELDVHMPIVKSGNVGTVEFVATKAGTFEYYCSVGEHRKLGQVGTLTVE
jgi:plastocyanin